MAAGATGTPTTLGIPKYATNADAPSGVGFNSAMDAIDALLGEAPLSSQISGIATGSVPVWNGSAWVKPTGTPDGSLFLRDDGTWADPAPASPTYDVQTYAPEWTSTGTQPSLGNGTLDGYYIQIGDFVWFGLTFILGSTSTKGTGSWLFSLPVEYANNQPNPPAQGTGNDVGTAIYAINSRVFGAGPPSRISLSTGGTTQSDVTGTAPFSWTTSDTLSLTGHYMAA